jgi:hypothetical protein
MALEWQFGEFNGQLSRRKSLEFPVFFPVAGNLGREGFARDWILRQVSLPEFQLIPFRDAPLREKSEAVGRVSLRYQRDDHVYRKRPNH